MPEFIPGITLCGMFYQEVVRPILEETFPGMPYSAALIGAGSEVLGFDTAMSTDHDWGPRLFLFLREEEYGPYHDAIRETLDRRLPMEFRGYPVRYLAAGSVRHHVALFTLQRYFQEFFRIDLDREMEPVDWLTLSEQELRTIIAGAVYHDGIGLEAVRARFAYYPQDIWLYLLASLWMRISQEEHLMGRAGYVGDELGSSLIASRLVRDLMRLCFLMERQYAPYPKWFGTAFQSLNCGSELASILQRVQVAPTWQEREAALTVAYERVAAMHNALGITEPLPDKVASFFDRPFQVIHLGGGFVNAICARIQDPAVLAIAARRLIGSVEQFSDSTDIVIPLEWRPILRLLYRTEDAVSS